MCPSVILGSERVLCSKMEGGRSRSGKDLGPTYKDRKLQHLRCQLTVPCTRGTSSHLLALHCSRFSVCARKAIRHLPTACSHLTFPCTRGQKGGNWRRYRGGSVGKMFAVQEREPKFGAQNLHKSWCKSAPEHWEGVGGMETGWCSVLTGQLVKSDLQALLQERDLALQNK